MPIEPQNAAERRLVAGIPKGGLVDVGTKKGRATIRATLVRDICLNPDAYSVPLRGLRFARALVKEQLDLHSGSLERPLEFLDCRFDQPLELTDARVRTVCFEGCEIPGISAWSLRVDGDFFIERSTVSGELNLMDARVEGVLGCVGATLRNPDGKALFADRLETGGGVFLTSGSVVKGEVRLLGAKIGGVLTCDGATLENPDGTALIADGMETGGGVFLNGGFAAKGEVRLLGTKISGHLTCDGATLENPNGDVLTAERMVVKGGFFWANFPKPPLGNVNLAHASATVFVDDGTGWPVEGHLILDGFCYDAFGPGTSCEQRLEWLRRQPSDQFFPQPYEQVIKVFKNAGREHDAREIAIAKQDDYCERGNLSRRHKLWLKILGATVRYGYEPWRIFWFIGVALAFALMVFNSGYQNGLIHPSKERVFIDDCHVNSGPPCAGWKTLKFDWTDQIVKIPADYPEFNSLVYAADTFFPFVNLHQEDFWLPKADGRRGGLLRFYLWFHILAGWVLSTIAVLGFTGVFKKD